MEKKINESTILLIAALVGLFINSLRLFQLLGLSAIENPGFVPITISDWLVRFIFLSFFSWTILKFNLDWLDRIVLIPIPTVRVFVALLGDVFILYSNHFMFLFIYELIFEIEIGETEQSGEYFGWYIVLLALLLIVFILRLQLKSKNDAIEKEQLKQEKIKSELVAIKNQVNPHFLFNSLNTLNSVIRKNPERATDFVDKLSFMYRYILQSSEKGLVKLAEELVFLDSYIHLMKIRYGNRFNVDISLNLDKEATEIPVLSLQLLVENAVKHNEISAENKLKVLIYNDNEFIIVENIIKPRISLEESSGNGLLNLSKRYKMLMDNDIKIYRTASFIVKLPIV